MTTIAGGLKPRPDSVSINTLPWRWLAGIVLMGIAVLAAWAGGILTFAILLGLTLTAVILMRPEFGLWLTVCTSLLWLLGAIRIPGLPLLGPSQIFSALTVAAWAVWAMTRRIPLTFATHMPSLALFFMVVGASMFTTGASTHDSLVGYQKYFMVFLPYFLTANIVVTRPAMKRMVWLILLTMASSVALALIELLLPGVENTVSVITLGARIDPSLDIGNIKRATGGMGDGNWFSYTMATCIPLSIYLFRTNPSFFVRIFAGTLVGLMCYGIVLSYTRMGFVGLAAGTLYLLWRRKLPWTPLVAALVLGLIASPFWMPKGFAERVLSIKYLQSGGSTAIREEIVGIAADLFLERPIFGHGYQRFGPQFMERAESPEGREMARLSEIGEEPATYLQAHNLILDLGVSFGLAGVLPFFSFVALLLRELAQIRVRSPQDEELATAITASLIAFLACGLGGHSQELKILWVLAGMVAALRRLVLEGQSITPQTEDSR